MPDAHPAPDAPILPTVRSSRQAAVLGGLIGAAGSLILAGTCALLAHVYPKGSWDALLPVFIAVATATVGTLVAIPAGALLGTRFLRGAVPAWRGWLMLPVMALIGGAAGMTALYLWVELSR